MNMQPGRLYQFGSFRLDAAERVLLREGTPVPLAPKAFDVLLVLVERRGHIVEKDDLLKAAWPDAFVEEGNLPVNVSLLRKVLGDDRRNGNRFIETVAKRGYRFIAPVVEIDSAAPIPVNGNTAVAPRTGASTPSVGGSIGTILHEAAADCAPVVGVNGDASGQEYPQGVPLQRLAPESQPARAVVHRSLWRREAAVVGALVAVAGSVWLLIRPLPPPTVHNPQPLTNSGLVKGSFGTDGQRLYFTEWTSTGDLVLRQMSVNGGESEAMPAPAGDLDALDVSPDRSSILLSSSSDPGGPIWMLPLPTGSPRRLGSLVGRDASWSPAGRSVAFCKDHEVWVANQDGSDPRRVAVVTYTPGSPRWSPDGTWLRFSEGGPSGVATPQCKFWEVSLTGAFLRPLLPGWREAPGPAHGTWTPDGEHFVFDSVSGGKADIWAIRQKGGGFHWGSGDPVKLTDLPQSSRCPLPSPDSKHLFFIGGTERGQLEYLSPAEKQFVSWLSGISAQAVAYSRDGDWIAYVRYPDRTLWCMKPDGSEARQLVYSPMKVQGLAWSPDGKQIAFNAWTPTNPFKNYLVAAAGGEDPRELQPGHTEREGIPSWSADGTKIAFGDVPETFGLGSRKDVIHILDLPTRHAEVLPGSQGFWSPRWSPDGRYIAALKNDDPDPFRQSLLVYDRKVKKWGELHVDHVKDLLWSHDGKYIYYDGESGHEGIFRVPVPYGGPELVANTNKVRMAGDLWFGLTPEDSPMILSDAGGEEIYSVDVDWR
jgi:DNA-binding winged helix-turn-helix (wHTH) protein/Tol biopolymer transport system component